MKSYQAAIAVGIDLGLLVACGNDKFEGSGKDAGNPEKPVVEAKSETKTDSANQEVPAVPTVANIPEEAGTPEPCQSGSVKLDSIRVVIPSNDGAVCAWGAFGNMQQNSSKLAARVEQRFPINIPSGRRVCSISAESGRQNIRYDDQLFLTLNDHVIVSSSKSVSRLTKAANGFPIYDWSKPSAAPPIKISSVQRERRVTFQSPTPPATSNSRLKVMPVGNSLRPLQGKTFSSALSSPVTTTR